MNSRETEKQMELMSGHGARPRRQTGRRDYVKRVCIRCSVTIEAPPSRIKWVFGMHGERCETATAEERLVFRKTRRWPKRTS